MPIAFLISSATLNKFLLIRLLFILLLNAYFIQASLLIGALLQNEASYVNSSIESDEEIVFKHAVYISNQYKLSFVNPPTGNYPTLMQKIIHIPKQEQLKAIKKICKDISGSMLALIGPQEENLKLYIKSLSKDLDLIHFDIEPTLNPSYSFNLFPALDIVCNAFADLIRKFEWKHVAIIYDSKTNLRMVKCLLSGPGQLMPKLDLTLRIANYESEYRMILRDISKRRITNLIIDLNPEESQTLLKMALQLGMINSTYHYILTTFDIETIYLEDFKYNRANITSLRLVQTDSKFHKLITYNLTDYYNNNWKDADKNKVLYKTRNALIFDSIFAFATAIKEAEKLLNLNEGRVSCMDDYQLEFGNLLASYLEKVNVYGLTGPIVFHERQRKDFTLDILQLKETGIFKCGTWSSSMGLNFTYYDEVYNEDLSAGRKNTFRVVTLVEEPYVMEEDGKFKGFCIDILDEIANKLNFKYEIYKVADNQFGSEDENGSWNGMIRELMDKRADLAISSFTINYKRQQVVDFTKPFISLGISILYKIPKIKKPGLFSFLNPLSLEIWIYTLITYILVSLIMMVLARFSPYEWRSTHPCNSDNDYVENQFNVWNSLWFAVGTLMQQGSDINPKALSTRLVGGCWWFFTLIIISSYTANLAAFLTVEKVDLTITNAEELANQTKITYGVFKGGSTMNFFKESRIDTYKRMWNVMQKYGEQSFVTSNKDGIDRVLNRDYAYLMESPLIDYEIQRNCNLTQIGGLLDSKGYGIATQQGSPYTEDISLKILEMQERGDIQKFYNKWWKSGGTCQRDEKKDADPLNIENVGGIFVVLVGGLLLAIFVSLFEFIYYAKKNSAKINKPLRTQIFDELAFAIKCGGSAKKLILPTPKNQQDFAVMRKNSFSNSARSSPALLTQSRKSCDELTHSDSQQKQQSNIISDHAIVCKHSSSTTNLTNPGLLIIEQESNIDPSLLINAHVLPHGSSSKQYFPHSSHHSHHQQQQQTFNDLMHDNNNNNNKKTSPKKKRKQQQQKEYIAMMPMNAQSANHENEKSELEKQVNYERYLSKSNIMTAKNSRTSSSSGSGGGGVYRNC